MTSVEFTNKYQEVEDIMFRFALKLTKSESSAQDLLQEAALKAFAKRKSFSGKSLFKSWFSTILYNSFINEYRSRQRRARLEERITALKHLMPNPSTSNSGYLQLVTEDVEKQIAAVGPKSRKALEMHIEGYQYKEISAALQIPTGTVKSRINYAREKAKKQIVQMGLYAQGA